MGKVGLTRKEKQARTRAALLEAAAELFTERGYRHVSLDEIAERAGVTKGAVYSNFGDKEELFAEVCAARSTEIKPDSFSGGRRGFEEQLRRMGVAAAEATLSAENAALAPLELEMFQLSLSNDRARQWVAATYANNRQTMAERLRQAVDVRGIALPPLPYDELATLLQATMHGLMQQRAVDPDAVPTSYFAHAFSLLVGNGDPRSPRPDPTTA